MIRAGRQKHLAVAGAILLVALFIAANAHLVTIAISSQPVCVSPMPGHAPAVADC